ncbi:MAG TPA: alkaline phosphatase family protein [Pseudonocardiaceae bacterium]|nr:alkaline phosphatase family protein [Pseudonocardiaceae bacterium]
MSATAAVGLALAGCASSSQATPELSAAHWGTGSTTTPIKHVVVLFDENISFDHYFGTYPNATNTDGTKFVAAPHTPKVNGLTPTLLNSNPNSYNPKRLSPSQALTCDQNHGYTAEQKAFDGGKMDKFVQNTETSVCTGQPILFGEPGLVMDYYDGNTVTALWNYAQHYSLNDNSYSTQFGPSTPGALNLIAGTTTQAIAVNSKTGAQVNPPDAGFIADPSTKGVGVMYSDDDPAYDDCSDGNHTSTGDLAALEGKNIGDLLNSKNITWGWFQGGFAPTGSANGYSVCGASHTNVGGNSSTDYSPHHNPFAYYKSTSNPKHLPPSSTRSIGASDQANHNYDLTDFTKALNAGNLPAVSFLKAPEYQDAHAGYSDPLDEQTFLTTYINQIERSKDWKNTAIVVAYDDSDGWYDHQQSTVVNGSHSSLDAQVCTDANITLAGGDGHCGYGPRQPLLVISPYAKRNYVDNTLTDQSSITKFIEDNWSLGRIGGGSADRIAGTLDHMFNFNQRPNTKALILDTKTGAVVSGH